MYLVIITHFLSVQLNVSDYVVGHSSFINSFPSSSRMIGSSLSGSVIGSPIGSFPIGSLLRKEDKGSNNTLFLFSGIALMSISGALGGAAGAFHALSLQAGSEIDALLSLDGRASVNPEEIAASIRGYGTQYRAYIAGAVASYILSFSLLCGGIALLIQGLVEKEENKKKQTYNVSTKRTETLSNYSLEVNGWGTLSLAYRIW